MTLVDTPLALFAFIKLEEEGGGVGYFLPGNNFGTNEQILVLVPVPGILVPGTDQY